MKVTEQAERWAPCVLSILRIVTAMLFVEHGTQKVLGFPSSSSATPPLWSLLGASGVLELAGGSLVLLGLFTRPVALVLSGQMAVAYFMRDAPRSIFPILNGGDADILFSFVFVYFAVAGGGRWSLDHMRNNERSGLRL